MESWLYHRYDKASVIYSREHAGRDYMYIYACIHDIDKERERGRG